MLRGQRRRGAGLPLDQTSFLLLLQLLLNHTVVGNIADYLRIGLDPLGFGVVCDLSEFALRRLELCVVFHL